MEHKILFDNNIFSIPVGNYFGVQPSKCLLIYAPISKNFFLANEKQVQELEIDLMNNKENPILKSLLSKTEKDIQKSYPLKWNTLSTLYILLNEKCNFNCSYCYSAKGRSKQELDINVLCSFIDCFMQPSPDTPQNRTLMFVGGGEPTLSWNAVKKATLYAEKIAQERDLIIKFRLSTNGSILTHEMIDFYKDHKFALQISYDVLPDVQSAQRDKWDIVDKNLKTLLSEHISCNIRSTITDLNVTRMSEMVEFCKEHYPSIAGLELEPVVDAEKFKTPLQIHNFFSLYRESFLQAKKVANTNHIVLGTSTFESIKQIRERFCYNLLCITPYNTLTLCPNVSSPLEKGYNEQVFGSIKHDSITGECTTNIDEEAFTRLTSNTIHTLPECKECWAKWNCGGGCPDQRRVYSKEIREEICNYQRQALLDMLILTLAERYNNHSHSDFFADIKEKLQND